MVRANAAESNMAPIQAPGATNKKAHHNGRAFWELLVAWGGIEPPTQGFSEHVLIKNPLFAVPVAWFRVTCYRTCYRKTT